MRRKGVDTTSSYRPGRGFFFAPDQDSGPVVTGATSTRLSKNVAPPPRSVRAVEVAALQFGPPAYFDHHTPKETTTPGFTVSPTTARARNRPRSLKTVTGWPSCI